MLKDKCIQWLKEWEKENAQGCNFIVGISGGKDSSIVAALLAETFGRDRVIGVMMPNGSQKDINTAYDLIDYLGIQGFEINIGQPYIKVSYGLISAGIAPSEQAFTNLGPRLRMSVLYAVSQSMNGRVVNTCNLSENYIGWSTRYGDEAGDFSPLGNLTVREVLQLGKELGLPDEFVYKVPEDGLTGKSDEDNFGFTYDELDEYILREAGRVDMLKGISIRPESEEKIKLLHKKSAFKRMPMPVFMY